MKLRPALTMVELMLVMSIVAIMTVAAVYSFYGSRQNLALKLSGDSMISQLERAHIFSREDKDEQSWGIKIYNDKKYALVSRGKTGETVHFYFELAEPTRFYGGETEIWFDRATGNTEGDMFIQIISPKGDIKNITVNRYGLIDVQ